MHRLKRSRGAAFREHAVELWRPAALLERSRQHACLMKGALDTGLHHVSKVQHTRAQLRSPHSKVRFEETFCAHPSIVNVSGARKYMAFAPIIGELYRNTAAVKY